MLETLDLNLTVAQYGAIGSGLILLYIVGLVVYRIWFHPLANYPGPMLAKITDAYYALNSVKGGWVHQLAGLHDKYGDVVRIAPNDLSFVGLESALQVYGHANSKRKPFLKSEFYDNGEGGDVGVASQRDPIKHREVRKSLAHAFSKEALKDQTVVVLEFVNLFIDRLAQYGTSEEGVPINEWYGWLTFDIIGDLAWGESFGAVKSARGHTNITGILDAVARTAWLDVARRLWSTHLYNLFIPHRIIAAYASHISFVAQKVSKRLSRPNDRLDFFSNLISDKSRQSFARTHNDDFQNHLIMQSNTLLIAGSETTATMMAGTTYYLDKNPQVLQRLKEEVRGAFKDSAEIDDKSTEKLPYLFGVIEESLRIYPPVPFSLPRVSPGAAIQGHYVPAGTITSISYHYNSHSPAYFADPWGFHPERWLPTSHPWYSNQFANDVLQASMPFSIGPRGCLGTNLAYMEMRIILAKLVWHFDWELLNQGLDWRRDSRHDLLWTKPEIRLRVKAVA